MGLRGALTDALLYEDFGHETARRGRAYARDDRVGQVFVQRDDNSVLSVRSIVRGSHSQPYVVELRAERFDGLLQIDSRCTCPIGANCKHGAALAYVVRGDAAEPAATKWERQLTGMLDEIDGLAPPTAGTGKLALQVELRRPRGRRSAYAPSQPMLSLRPLREGARQNWVKTGVRWADMTLAAPAGRAYEAGQVEAMSRMYAALITGRTYWTTGDVSQLHEFGPTLWSLLTAARDAGVLFVPAGELASVELLDEPLEVSADVVEAGTGAALTLGVQYDGESWTGDRLVPIGLPAHGVVLLRETRARPRAKVEVHAVLARLRRPVPASVVRMLGGEPVTVPRAGRAGFEESLLPRLQRQLPVGSSNGSVTLPELPPPRLRLTVDWRSVREAHLVWEWVYRVGTRERTCPLAATDPLDGLRDSVAETALLDRVEALWKAGRPADDRLLTSDATIGFAELDLPALRDSDLVADGLVEVVETDAPLFREAQGAVEVRFDAADPSDERPATTDWLDLSVSIRVDDETIPLREVLTALTTGQDRILLASGLHISTERPELAALRDLVRSAAELRDIEGDRLSVGSHDLGLWAQLAELGVVDEQASEWVRRARALRDLVELPTPEPVGVVTTLRSYQLEGFHWLAFLHEHGLGGILADDMGLGKTLQVLALISHAREAGAAPFLVVAPTSVVTAWQSESARHTPHLRVHAVASSAARRHGSLESEVAGADVVLTSYTLLRLDADEYSHLTWGGLVLDEAQQVKNHQSRGYQAVRRIRAPFKLAVTGTPFENRLLELWALLSITNPGLYPWPEKFTEYVAKPVEKNSDSEALGRFRQRIRPFLLRRTKELVAADLPPKQEQVLEVQLGSKHRKVYDTHLQKERQKILGLVDDFGRNRIAIFASLTRLRQLALDAALVDPEHEGLGSAKLDALVEHLHEIGAEGHRALVFSQFTGFLGRVRARLEDEGLATAYLDGGTRDRGAVIDGFRHGTAPVFLISLKAGGVGLTLTEADYVFVLDPWWNPAAEAQAVDRTHRIGQTKPVMVYRLVASDTIEEKVMELKARKAELFTQVIDGDGAMSSAIGAEDIRALFDD